jgi:carboxypeptidase Taq
MTAIDADPALPAPVADLLSQWADIASLGSAAAVLEWDQETQMAGKGQAGRGRALAVLAGIRHERLTDPALADAIEAAAEHAEPGSLLDVHIREARREVRHASALPEELARQIAAQESRSLAAWQQARADDDFDGFVPVLAEMVGLVTEKADALVAAGIADRRYDALLDEYEPGATEAELVPLLGSLRDELSPIVKAVADSGVQIDESAALGDFPGPAQEAFGRMVAETMGYDFEAGRLDESAHPFTTSFGVRDVRITWRFEPDDFRPGLFGIMHEAGHALYEQGIDPDLEATPAGNAVSLGIHESQSRLWENLVGRSRPFWEWALPHWHEAFPHKADVTLDQLWPALHTVRPSLIRVEADEVTYNLHVVARFEIERALFAGEITVPELSDRWDATYEELLGIRPPSPADGVLQDIHWSMGAFGYFPTYTLGNVVNAQLFEAAERDLGDLGAQFRNGELGPLLGWLRDRIHRHGRRYTAAELIEQATGAPLTTDAFLRHIRSTVHEAYGVGA